MKYDYVKLNPSEQIGENITLMISRKFLSQAAVLPGL